MKETHRKKKDSPDSNATTASDQASPADSDTKVAPFVPKRWPIFIWSFLWVGWIGFLFFMMVTRTGNGQPL